MYKRINSLRMLHEKLYTGRYERQGRTNDDFCPAIIAQELFDPVQKLTAGNVKATPTGRKYLFSSLLICAKCGHRRQLSRLKELYVNEMIDILCLPRASRLAVQRYLRKVIPQQFLQRG